VSISSLDRWLRFNLLNRNSHFKINLHDCIDEWGNTYGKNGNHIFIRIIENNGIKKDSFNVLKNWYADSDNQIEANLPIISDKDNQGNIYFCPWENNRIRPIKKFLRSHKIGPTPDEFIPEIILRLEGIYKKIKIKGYMQKNILQNNLIRVIKIINEQGDEKYIIRDGQHRAAVLSSLNYKTIQVCYDADYHDNSRIFKYFYNLIKKGNLPRDANGTKIVNINEAEKWPHVLSGLISRDNALKQFNRLFEKTK
jgi:hypothetical protein